MKKYLSMLCFVAFYAAQSHASTEATFSLVANTPTTISVPTNRHTYVQYAVTNNTATTRTLTMVPIQGVTQDTSGSHQCSSPFVLGQGESCNLTLYVDGSQIASNYAGGPVVCKTKYNSNEPDPYLCSQPEPSMALSISSAPAVTATTNKLYVSNWDGNSISLCYLQAGTGTPSHCHVTAVSGTFANPEALAVSGNFLFVANIGGGISACTIDPTTGDLSLCTSAATNAPIYAPTGIAINGGFAYIANSGPEQFHQGVTVCTVAAPFLVGCSFNQGDATFSVPSDLAVANSTVYISNFNSQNVQTTYCALSGSPLCSSPDEGVVSGTSNLLNEPEGIVFADVNGNPYVYFTNHGNNSVTYCQVSAPDTFSNCTTTGGYFNGFGNLAILSTPLKAFIPSGLKTISSCDVNATDGSLSNCVNSAEAAFNNPSGLLITN